MTIHWTNLTTPQRIDMIKSVYETGNSARDIGARIGITRNAVIGMYGRYPDELIAYPLGGGTGRRHQAKANRVHKQARGTKQERKPKRPIVLADFDNRNPLFKTKPSIPATLDYESRNLTLMELEPADCRWPTNDAAKGEEHRFCGHTRLVGYSFCEKHAFRAYTRAA